MKLRLPGRLPGLLTRLAAFWREIEPGIRIDRNNFVERWDAKGEGRATCIAFEGFGVTGTLFIGRTPPTYRTQPASPAVVTGTVPADALAAIRKTV